MSSSVLAAKGALVSVITTAINDPSVSVTWGLPDYQPDDLVVVLGATGTLAHAAMGPTRPRDEQFALTATVSVYRGGTSQQLVTTRAWALFDLIEAAVRANPTLSGAVQTATVSGYDMEEALSLGEGDAVLGRVCEIIIRVEVRARV